MIYGLPFQDASYPVTSGFGPRQSPTAGASSYHWGYDFGTPLGTPLYAPVGATVDFMGADTADLDGDGVPDGLGNYLRLLMPGGETMYYGHLDRFAPGLEVGATIDPGTLLAYTGSSGISTGPHLDIRMRDAQGNRIDPTPFLGLNTEMLTDDGAAMLGVAGHRDPYTRPTGDSSPGNPIYSIPENAITDSYNTWIAPTQAGQEPQGQQPMLGLLNDNQITGGLLGTGQQGGFMDGVNMPLLMAGAQILANSGPSLEPRSMFEGVPNALMGGVQAQEAQARAQEERQRRLQREQAQQRLMQSGLLSPEMQAAVEAGYGDQVMAGLFSSPEVPSMIRTAEALGIPLDDPRLINRFLEGSGNTNVSVNLPPQQSEFEEAVGAGQGERYIGWLTAADAASGTMNVINQAMPLLDQARTGFGAETLADAQRAADRLFGPGAVNIGDPQGVAQLSALTNELVLTQAERMAGVLSDSDIALLRSTMANSGNDPETNRRIMEFLRARTQWAIDRAAAAQAYVDQHGNITGFTFDPIPPLPRFGNSGASGGGNGLLNATPDNDPLGIR